MVLAGSATALIDCPIIDRGPENVPWANQTMSNLVAKKTVQNDSTTIEASFDLLRDVDGAIFQCHIKDSYKIDQSEFTTLKGGVCQYTGNTRSDVTNATVDWIIRKPFALGGANFITVQTDFQCKDIQTMLTRPYVMPSPIPLPQALER
jgi:hypothetical protein